MREVKDLRTPYGPRRTRVGRDIHVTTAKELAGYLAEFGDLPVFFATSASSKPMCVLSVYDDVDSGSNRKAKKVWIDIGTTNPKD